MNKSRQSKKERPYRIKKTGIKDENIDRQILVIHRAIGEKLIQQPEQVERIKTLLEERKDNGRMGYAAYITWFSLLSLIDNQQAFMQALLENSSKMRRLRRATPFLGILNEQERRQALEQFACGNTSVETLL